MNRTSDKFGIKGLNLDRGTVSDRLGWKSFMAIVAALSLFTIMCLRSSKV